MKKLFLAACVSVFLIQSAQAGETKENSSNGAHQGGITYTAIPFKSYQLTDSQTILATFQIKCFEKFIHIFRHDVQVSPSEVTTVVGAIVEANQFSPCSEAEDITVDAGWHYSGRRQNIVTIETQP